MTSGPLPEAVRLSGHSDLLVETEDERLLLNTAHCTIIAADIEGFGQHHRNNANQVRLRHGMYEAMRASFDAAGIPWSECRREDRGDGVLVLASADVRKRLFADHLPDALVEALSSHNRLHPPRERIRLRLALHAGEVNFDLHGVTGSAINHTFRLLDSDVLKTALGSSSAALAIISSAWFFDDVIRHNELSRAKTYRQVEAVNKETQTQAWIRLLRPPVVRHLRPRDTRSA
ncbi:hypothetical protein [Lentzea albida]|uniref:Guanylate cyclase domain-containing protein n=1 Tax=Lentzea albida TaxID=65499 RepID=A0A1H9IP15_9PSEU|nr:hypothetical protein [Lentzea albida]SEQ76501.1 hypothetical protein SAMN04488000_104277 [Lentzea albida]